MPQLKKLIYKSDAVVKDVDLEQLLINARAFNRSVGITGVLLTSSVGFIQYIEGPEQQIDTLFNKISQDSRHTNVQLLASAFFDAQDREYQNWDMGYLFYDNHDELANQVKSDYFTEMKNIVADALPMVEG